MHIDDALSTTSHGAYAAQRLLIQMPAAHVE